MKCICLYVRINSKYRLRIKQIIYCYIVLQCDYAMCLSELSVLGKGPSSKPLKFCLYLLRYICNSHMPITAPSDRLFITVSCAVRDHSINGSSLTAHDLIAKCIFCVMSFARPCRPRKFKHTIDKLPITVPLSHLCHPHSRYARVPLPVFCPLPSRYQSISDALFGTILDEIRELTPNQMQNTIECNY